jgi:hypothetical protein
VVAGAIVTDVLANITTDQKRNPARIEVRNIPGNSIVTVRWIVQGAGPFTITADSPKGGVHSRTFR